MLLVGYAVMFAVMNTVVRFVTVVKVATFGMGKTLIEPDAPVAIMEEVLVAFHPYEFGPVKIPPVGRGKG